MRKQQTERFHETLAVDTEPPIFQKDWKRMRGGHGNEILNILNTVEADYKLLVIFHLKLYKPFFFMYNTIVPKWVMKLLYQHTSEKQL